MGTRPLTQADLDLVRAVISHRRISDKLLRDECESAGMVALMEAARTHDPELLPWTNYVALRVRWAVMDVLRDEIGAPLSGCGRHNPDPPEILNDDVLEDHSGGLRDPQSEAIIRDQLRLLAQAIDGLPNPPERLRRVCRAYYLEDKDREEIMKSEQVGREYVNQLLRFGTRRLKKILDRGRDS